MLDFIANYGFDVMVGFITFCVVFVCAVGGYVSGKEARDHSLELHGVKKRPYFSELLKQSEES